MLWPGRSSKPWSYSHFSRQLVTMKLNRHVCIICHFPGSRCRVPDTRVAERWDPPPLPPTPSTLSHQTPQTLQEEEYIALGGIHSNAYSPKLGITWWVQGESDWGPVGGEAGVRFKAFQTGIKLQYITLNYTTLHYTTLHYTKLHYTTLHYTTLNKLHFTTLH